MNGIQRGILDVPPPVVSRSFQELSRGMVTLTDARKITEFPFPFPYVQMIQVMLLIHFVSTPIICSILVTEAAWAALLSFVAVFSLWSVNFIGAELEIPFGDDHNDLPIREMQNDLNRSLWSLTYENTRTPPRYEWSGNSSARKTRAWDSDNNTYDRMPEEGKGLGGKASHAAKC